MIGILAFLCVLSVALAVGLLRRRVKATGSQTEFTAEVVRVVERKPHPNADRLEIVRFELKGSGPSSYEVVTQKDAYRVGELAAYLSVDCIVPTQHPEFRFLTERPDGAGKTHYRIRAARLRGTFSQGLLVGTPPGLTFGDSVAEHFGITYHSPDIEEELGPTPATRKKRAQPMPIYGVDSLKKCPNLFAPEETVSITEKIHGTNFRFGWVRRKLFGIPFGWRFVVGSHRMIKDGGKGGFYKEDLWTRAAKDMDLAARTRGYPGLVFYGELYGCTKTGQKIQDLTYSAAAPELVVFDVLRGGEWVGAIERTNLLAAIGLDGAPLLYVGKFGEAPQDLAEGKSTLDGKTQREGIVVESLEGERRKAKFVGTGYLLRKGA